MVGRSSPICGADLPIMARRGRGPGIERQRNQRFGASKNSQLMIVTSERGGRHRCQARRRRSGRSRWRVSRPMRSQHGGSPGGNASSARRLAPAGARKACGPPPGRSLSVGRASGVIAARADALLTAVDGADASGTHSPSERHGAGDHQPDEPVQGSDWCRERRPSPPVGCAVLLRRLVSHQRANSSRARRCRALGDGEAEAAVELASADGLCTAER